MGHSAEQLADLPHVVKGAPALLKAKEVSERVTIAPHDFFISAPEGCDAYVLSRVIHDWSEAQCLTIWSMRTRPCWRRRACFTSG